MVRAHVGVCMNWGWGKQEGDSSGFLCHPLPFPLRQSLSQNLQRTSPPLGWRLAILLFPTFPPPRGAGITDVHKTHGSFY